MMNTQEQLADVAKVTPPLAITGMEFFGVPVSVLVLWLTALYTALQIVIIVRRELSRKKNSAPTCIKDCAKRVSHDTDR